jgi:peptidoglycan LD-endopeptidase LytH
MRSRAGCGLAVLVAVAMLAGCSLTRRRQPSVYDALQARRLMVPVAGVAPAQLTDNFNAPRGHGTRRHLALDILAPHGTPVLAADDGEVLAVKTNQLGGRVVYATDPGRRFVYYYAHLSRWHPDTVPGRRVERGDVLGYVGTTGNARGRAPHLHFQVRMYSPDGRYWTGPPLNPLACFARPGRRVTP